MKHLLGEIGPGVILSSPGWNCNRPGDVIDVTDDVGGMWTHGVVAYAPEMSHEPSQHRSAESRPVDLAALAPSGTPEEMLVRRHDLDRLPSKSAEPRSAERR